ncbi:ATP-binding cassette domain-containing protein [Leptospira sp. WS39.C2]
MPHHISIHNLTFQFESQSEPLFQNLNLHFSKGWTGIVGKNGSGKSTLAKIISRELVPSQGKVVGNGSSCSLSQGTEITKEEIYEFLSLENKVSGFWMSLFQIQMDTSDDYERFSFGEKRRFQLTMVLSKEPDVLILDEPTNHLDTTSVKLIREAMDHYQGIGILISHDRDLLDGLVSSCIFLEKNFYSQRIGNYTSGKKEIEREKEERIHNWENAKREHKKLESELKRRRMEASLSHKQRSKKGLDIHDHDGRYQKNLARLSGKDGQAGRLKNQIQRRVENSETKEKGIWETLPEKETIGFEWKTTKSRKRSLCLLDDKFLDFGFMNLILTKHFEIKSDARIAITGKNGGGKSTFLKYLNERFQVNGIRSIYLPQEFSKEGLKDLYQEFQNLLGAKKANVLSLIHRLGSDPKRFSESEALSPGEGKKLFVSLRFEENPEVILLDEPTNHFDLKSLEALETSLREVAAALVFVSHDRRFVETVADNEWVLENFRLTEKHLDRI